MTTPVAPQAPAPATGTSASGRWTLWAFLTQVAYVVWLPAMFAFGYLLADLFGYEPGVGEQVGVAAMLVNILVAVLVIPLPSWVGVGLAARARRLGGRAAALVALVLCALTGIVLTVMSLPINGV